METVLEGTWNERWRSRLHLAPEGMAVVHSDGQVAATVEYSQVKNVGVMPQGRRHGMLSIDLGSQGVWVLSKLHPLQAQYGASLIQEQMAALQRAQLPVFAERQALARQEDPYDHNLQVRQSMRSRVAERLSPKTTVAIPHKSRTGVCVAYR